MGARVESTTKYADHGTFRQYAFVFALSLLAGATAYPVLSVPVEEAPQARNTSAWPSYGNDVGGMRFAELNEITPENVSKLKVAWKYKTGDKADGIHGSPSMSAFEATPVLVGGRLVFCTPFNRVVALDPLTGKEIWPPYDPGVDRSVAYENQLTCRGVSAWIDKTSPPGAKCEARIFTGTNDGRLIAIDAADGKPCESFGDKGQINLRREEDIGKLLWNGEYQVTSPPAVIKDIVVVGSAIADNQRTDAPSGVVRAFDARTGRLRWAQDLAPKDYSGPRTANGYALGTPNVWSIMSVDESLNLIFLPTGNPAPDFFHGDKRPPDKYGSSVVALNADTGQVVWSFQTVHHDLWDYDVPAQPALFPYKKEDGTVVPALAQATKTGHLFILDRRDGKPIEPIFGITEIPVPQSAVAGEVLSKTQPFPNRPKALGQQRLWKADVKGSDCIDAMGILRSEGIFTPPSLQGTVFFPGSGGGLNWSGVAIDPGRQVLVTNSTNVPWTVRLFPGDKYEDEKRAHPKSEVRPQRGTPFGMMRSFLTHKMFFGLAQQPCNPPPWGRLNFVDLRTGLVVKEMDLGGYFGNEGLPSLGGAILTSTGVAFIAGTLRDEYLRAFNVETKQMLWKGKLPAGGNATPMTYVVNLTDGSRKQFVVIAAGGNGRATSKLGDTLVAFSIPKQ